MRSEVFYVENFIAFFEYLVSLSAQVKFLADVAHVEKLLAVLLQQKWTHVEVSSWYGDDKWPPDHLFGDEDSPAEQYISDKEGVAESLEDDVIVILSRE